MQRPSSATRKRPAPGASPIMQQQAMAQNDYSNIPSTSDFNTNFDFPTDNFNPADQPFADLGLADSNLFAAGLNGSQTPAYDSSLAPAPISTDLVRRARSQQLAPSAQQEQWNRSGDMPGQADDEDEQALERKVALARRDAQGKRKQIPPFVQKLSSFLDSGNTELIRWSHDGRSFIVIDEDEFARTLIPELFKHNNYASFVRQLNMYGFHKTVNITDGSLRQSEKARKGVKPPSMYSHPYFRRNRPDLLWLIQKPSTKSNAKRKRDGTTKGDFDSDDERHYSPIPDAKPSGEPGDNESQELVNLPRSELIQVRRELMELRRQQKYIRDVIDGLKQQNDQFYRQATQFQALHERHENSINAILTFLATFYNRSLEGHAGQNLVNMFTSGGQQSNQQQGSVVEDLNDSTPEAQNQMQKYKRPLLLPPPTAASAGVGSAPASNRSSASPTGVQTRRISNRLASSAPETAHDTQNLATSPLAKDDGSDPNALQSAPESDQMMNVINSVNASTPGSTSPDFDFSAALNHYQNANGNAPLTPQERNDVLALMANQQNAQASNNNALVSPAPPSMPDLSQFRETQRQLEMLTNMQKTQDEKVQELNRRLQPLSPTGNIPGIGDAGDGAGFFDVTGGPGEFDPNSFLNFDNDADINFDFNGAGQDGADGDVNWDFGNAADGAGDMFQTGPFAQDGNTGLESTERPNNGEQGRVESISSAATSPNAAAGDEPATPKKRQRRN